MYSGSRMNGIEQRYVKEGESMLCCQFRWAAEQNGRIVEHICTVMLDANPYPDSAGRFSIGSTARRHSDPLHPLVSGMTGQSQCTECGILSVNAIIILDPVLCRESLPKE